MKKFDRLPAAARKEEIKTAALQLFLKKGFRATTMENIVAEVSLSKGGVYRLYPSTMAILSDIILDGARMRNTTYHQLAQQKFAQGTPIDAAAAAEIICEGMFCYPEVAEIYTEFLFEKRRIPELETLYQTICEETTRQTLILLGQMGLQETLKLNEIKLQRLTDIMNTAILGIVVLNQRENSQMIKGYLMPQLRSVLEGEME